MFRAVTFMVKFCFWCDINGSDIYGKRCDIYGELWYLREALWYLWGTMIFMGGVIFTGRTAETKADNQHIVKTYHSFRIISQLQWNCEIHLTMHSIVILRIITFTYCDLKVIFRSFCIIWALGTRAHQHKHNILWLYMCQLVTGWSKT